MTFNIHASKNGQSVVTIRISPAVAVDKARSLECSGWQVHITDAAGHRFDPSDFDRLSSLARETALLALNQPYLPPLTDRLAETTVSDGGDAGREGGGSSVAEIR